MANPPFNVNAVDKDRLSDDPRFPFGLPRPDNANYIWIQTFYSGLNERGRAGFVMANSASDARSSEQDIRQKLIAATPGKRTRAMHKVTSELCPHQTFS
jgi:type I restriction enzyme M protein